MRLLQQQQGVAAKALEFLILTASMPGEALYARWDEIDLGARIWTIPPARTKSGQQSQVPLSGPAIALLKEMQQLRTGQWIFPGKGAGKVMSYTTMLSLLGRMGRSDVKLRGFCKSFRYWAEAKRIGLALEGVEMASADLANPENRGKLLDDWASFCGATSQPGEIIAYIRPDKEQSTLRRAEPQRETEGLVSAPSTGLSPKKP
jgi:hypothetical protein